MGTPRNLAGDLERLVAAGVLDGAAAERVRAFYGNEDRRGPGPLPEILSVLGGILVCAGIVLLVAYNWNALPRTLKTAIAFLLVASPGGAGLYALTREKPAKSGTMETIALFHSLLFGAALALIGQIYQLPENVVSFLSVYAASALVLAYLYRSLGAATAALVLGQILAAFLAVERDAPPILHAAFALPALPLWAAFRARGERLRAGWTATATALALAAATVAVLVHTDGRAWMALLAAFASFSLASGAFLEDRGERAGRRLRAWGSALGVVLAFAGSWSEVWDGADAVRGLRGSAGLLFGLYVVSAAAFVGFRVRRTRIALPLADLLPLTLAAAQIGLFGDAAPLAASLCVVAYAALGFRAGWRERSLKQLNGAFILSLAFAIARFLDMTDSMLVRGAAFLAGGVSVFVFNRLIAARLRRSAAEEAKDGR
jgi:hypothetical protein